MGVAKNFVVKNGIEVNSNLFVANSDTSKVGIASTGPRTTLDVRGGIACTDISVSSAATFNTFNSVTGIITNAHFENVIVNGITTLSSLNLNDVRAVNVNASGIGTFAVGIVTNLSGDNLNFGDINSGVGSIAGFLFKGGIMTSTALGAGIVTYFGDGGNLSNLPGASPGGSNFQVQFNASAGGVGVFSGHSGLTYNYQTLGATSLNVSTGATFGTGINVVGGGLTVTGISTFNGNISVLTGNITLGTYNSGAQVIADQIISGAGAGAAGAQINKGVYNTRVDDDSGVEQNAFNIGNFNNLNSMQIGGRGTITTKGGIVGVALSITGIATCTTAIVGSAVSISAGALDGGRTVRILGENLNVLGIATAQDFDSLSDINFKENVSTVDNALASVEQLRGVSFNWKESGEPSYGVIAQELETILPELVHGDDPKRVNYNGIIGVLIEAVKELSAEVKQLKAQDPK
jgi:hypothetical protein